MSDEFETLGAAASGAVIDQQIADLSPEPCHNFGAGFHVACALDCFD
jgi:hypothetical protein